MPGGIAEKYGLQSLRTLLLACELWGICPIAPFRGCIASVVLDQDAATRHAARLADLAAYIGGFGPLSVLSASSASASAVFAISSNHATAAGGCTATLSVTSGVSPPCACAVALSYAKTVPFSLLRVLKCTVCPYSVRRAPGHQTPCWTRRHTGPSSS